MTTESTERIRPATILDLHKIGFKVVPLAADGKTPAMAWTEIYEANWKIEDLGANYDKFTNIATCFGKSHIKDQENRDLYLHCLDIDSEEVDKILFGLERSFVPWAMERTYVTKTRKKRGFHVYWFEHETHSPIRSEDCKPNFQFEIKTNKSSGLATLPPSRHRDDPDFHYEIWGKPDSVAVIDGLYDQLRKALAECLRSTKQSRTKIVPDSNDDTEIEFEDAEIDEIVKALVGIYRPGHRNSICLHLAGYLCRQNVALDSAKEIFARLTNDDEEKRSRFLTLEQTYDKRKDEVTGYIAFFKLVSALTDPESAKKICSIIYAQILTHKGVSSPGDFAFQLAETIKKEWIFKTMNDTRQVYYYQNGRYLPNGERIIEIECPKLMPKVKTAVVNETIEMIRRTTPADRADFDRAPSIVNVKNGLLDIETGELKPHDPQYLSLVQLPADYDKEAKCPAIERFLQTSLDEVNQDKVLRLLGDVLTPDYRYQSFYFLIGSGRNGKGTLGRLRAFTGPDNYTSIRLQSLSNDRFAKAHLYGKIVNFAGDVN